MSDGAYESLPAACQEALERQTRLLAGEPLNAGEQEQLAAHLAACAACRRLAADLAEADGELRAALAATRAGPDFAARVMAALPLAPELPLAHARGSDAPAPRVFMCSRRRSWISAAAGIAAAVAVAALLVVWLKLSVPGTESAALVLKKGRVLSASGQEVRALKLGEVYRVQETAVFPLTQAGLLKVQPGAEFKLQSTADGAALRLKSGDMYVWGKDEQKPVRVATSNFEAVLQKGDFFVAEETAEAPAGVVIVFAGRAQVAFENGDEPLPLRAGQVFLTIGEGDETVNQTLELPEAVEQLAGAPVVAVDVAAQRKEYAERVRGYQQELKLLEQQVGAEQDGPRRAELRERYQRVLAYRDAHRRRLDSMLQSSPFEAIRRGLEGHSDDPAHWL